MCLDIDLLTHWSLGDLDSILKVLSSILFYWLVSSDLLMIVPSDEWDLCEDKSTLVQVMTWCHYLSQCWPRSVSPYGVTGAQWVNYEACVLHVDGNVLGTPLLILEINDNPWWHQCLMTSHYLDQCWHHWGPLTFISAKKLLHQSRKCAWKLHISKCSFIPQGSVSDVSYAATPHSILSFDPWTGYNIVLSISLTHWPLEDLNQIFNK